MTTIRTRLGRLERQVAERPVSPGSVNYPDWISTLIAIAWQQGAAPADVVAAHLGLSRQALRDRVAMRAS